MSDQPHQPYDSPPPDTDGPVTTTVTRRVKPGHEPFDEQFGIADFDELRSRRRGLDRRRRFRVLSEGLVRVDGRFVL